MSNTSGVDQTAAPVVSESFTVTVSLDPVRQELCWSIVLSEQSDKRILLIEAGGADTKNEIHMPAAW